MAVREVICVTAYGNIYRAHWFAIEECERRALERNEFVTDDMDEARRVAKVRLAALRNARAEV